MQNRKRSQEPKPKTPNPAKLASLSVAWLDKHGFFAVKMFVDGAMLVLAIKSGKPFAICTADGATGPHDPKGVLSSMERAGAKTLCIQNIQDLEDFIER